MRFIRSSVVAACAAIMLALVGCSGDTADTSAPEVPPSVAPTVEIEVEASPSPTVPEGLYAENYGCTSIVAAVDGEEYSAPGCYYAPSSVKVTYVTECGFETTFENGGTVTRIKSCETILDPTCTEVQEFGPNGEYIPQQGPNGFFVELEGEGCYYVPGHLKATTAEGCNLTEGEAPDGWRRYEVAC